MQSSNLGHRWNRIKKIEVKGNDRIPTATVLMFADFEINNAIDYIIKCKSVTGQVLTIDSGQSLGWANSKSKIFSRD